ncbi:MAG: hypothetical protein V4485_05325 [Pseudomonadota bacterium]
MSEIFTNLINHQTFSSSTRSTSDFKSAEDKGFSGVLEAALEAPAKPRPKQEEGYEDGHKKEELDEIIEAPLQNVSPTQEVSLDNPIIRISPHAPNEVSTPELPAMEYSNVNDAEPHKVLSPLSKSPKNPTVTSAISQAEMPEETKAAQDKETQEIQDFPEGDKKNEQHVQVMIPITMNALPIQDTQVFEGAQIEVGLTPEGLRLSNTQELLGQSSDRNPANSPEERDVEFTSSPEATEKNLVLNSSLDSSLTSSIDNMPSEERVVSQEAHMQTPTQIPISAFNESFKLELKGDKKSESYDTSDDASDAFGLVDGKVKNPASSNIGSQITPQKSIGVGTTLEAPSLNKAFNDNNILQEVERVQVSQLEALPLDNKVDTAHLYTAPRATYTYEAPRNSDLSPVDQVSVAVERYAGREGDSRISINLYPAELGKVEVDITVQSGVIKEIKLYASRDTLDVLMKDSVFLEKALQEVTKGEGASLSFNLKDGNQNESHKEKPESLHTNFNIDLEVLEEQRRVGYSALKLPEGRTLYTMA